MNTRFRAAYAAVLTTGLLGALAACGTAHAHDGTIRPGGSRTGTFPYCAYKLDDDGIEIDHHAHTPCVVGDARSKKDLKKKHKGGTSYAVIPTGKTKTPSPSKSKAPSTGGSFKAPSAPKKSGSSVKKSGTSFKKC